MYGRKDKVEQDMTIHSDKPMIQIITGIMIDPKTGLKASDEVRNDVCQLSDPAESGEIDSN